MGTKAVKGLREVLMVSGDSEKSNVGFNAHLDSSAWQIKAGAKKTADYTTVVRYTQSGTGC